MAKVMKKGNALWLNPYGMKTVLQKARPHMQLPTIFSRPNDKKRYTDMLYMDKNMKLDSLPEEIKLLLDDELLHI